MLKEELMKIKLMNYKIDFNKMMFKIYMIQQNIKEIKFLIMKIKQLFYKMKDNNQKIILDN